MSKGMLGAIAPFLVGVLCATTARAQEPLQGDWEGAIQVMGQELGIIVHFSDGEEGLDATIDIPQQGAYDFPLEEVSYDPPRVHFELEGGSGLAVFDGQREGDRIEGDFEQAGVMATFYLQRAPAVEEEGAASETGSAPGTDG